MSSAVTTLTVAGDSLSGMSVRVAETMTGSDCVSVVPSRGEGVGVEISCARHNEIPSAKIIEKRLTLFVRSAEHTRLAGWFGKPGRSFTRVTGRLAKIIFWEVRD